MALQITDDEVDVLICGGGPVGLLTGYCLARYGISTYIVEQHERSQQTRYGRAAMIAPRTLEMLDRLDLADALGQIGFVVRGQASYKDGEKVETITSAASNISDTFFDYLLLCRQRYTEDVIRDGYSQYSRRAIDNGAELVDFVVEDGGTYPVVSTIQRQTKEQSFIRSKYIIGADGSRSTVRTLAQIPFEGEHSNRNWVRIDGIVSTDMPESRRGICGISSSSHGSVLWACLDHGATRIGFALTEKVWNELGANITKEDIICEAKKALQPFTLEFHTVDWWTVYSVGQRLASHYRAQGRIFIAGDAAHTHSSGAAQGMNTGLHDAVNLSWKLAGVLNGWLVEKVLDTYEAERRPIAQQIIEQDKIISVATSGEIPANYKNDPDADPHQILTETYQKNAALNTGLGITYPPDDLTITPPSHFSKTLTPGSRAPDTLLQRPGIRFPLRLHSLLKSNGRFSLVRFCGTPSQTHTQLQQAQHHVSNPRTQKIYETAISTSITIIHYANDFSAASERLGVSALGDVFYDTDGSAHERHGVSDEIGAVSVLRPDGTIGMICGLGDEEDVVTYLARFVITGEEEGEMGRGNERGKGVRALEGVGEVEVEGEQ